MFVTLWAVFLPISATTLGSCFDISATSPLKYSIFIAILEISYYDHGHIWILVTHSCFSSGPKIYFFIISVKNYFNSSPMMPCIITQSKWHEQESWISEQWAIIFINLINLPFEMKNCYFGGEICSFHPEIASCHIFDKNHYEPGNVDLADRMGYIDKNG